MRILQVIHDFLPHHAAGSELYTFYLAKELQKRHSVYVMFTEVDRASFRDALRRQGYYARARAKFGEAAWAVIQKASGVAA